VAERLLRSGALDDSAAQLLRQPEMDSAPEVKISGATNGAADPDVAVSAEPSRRSSLFAPPPNAVAPQTGALALPASTLGDAPEDDDEPPEPPGGHVPAAPVDAVRKPPLAAPVSGPVLPSPAILAPAILGQVRPLGGPAMHTALLERPTDFATPDPAAAARGLVTDPAASLLQGPLSVDAVSLERAGMVDWSRTRTRISEEFRLVQRQIIRSAFGPGAEPGFSNLLLVTSARPGEGKSFMSTNLSGSIARQGDHHVLLVDADSKRDSICYSLGLAQARGLLDLAANPKLDPSPLIVRTPIERLSILPVGRERERSAELFSTKEMTRLIQSLGRRYADRLLILDAPPCLSTSDPAVLAQVVGQILFVVEADRTQRDEIEASLDLIQACPTITMVLNKQQISSRYTFGAYSSYYSS
jgi:receptor protein-tyrosine kinase